MTDIELRTARLVRALENIVRQEPANDGTGGLFQLMTDGEGNELGTVPVDPVALVGHLLTIAKDALEEYYTP